VSAWSLELEGFDPKREGLREALCTLGNGRFATRGAAAETEADGVHYPGTYLAGGYDRRTSEVAGRSVENEDLVNLPNWLPLRLRIGEGPWLSPRDAELLSWRQVLDLRHGVLERQVRLRDATGRRTDLAFRRLVSMEDPALAAEQLTVAPVGWSGPVTLHAALDGRVQNRGVARYGALDGRHLAPIAAERCGPDAVLLAVETLQSRLRVAEGARTRVFEAGAPIDAERRAILEEGYAAEELSFRAEAGRPFVVEKTVALQTSRDRAISEPAEAAARRVASAGRFEDLLAAHVLRWEQLWRRCDLELDGPDLDRTQRIVRLHVFHLLQTVSPHTTDLDVGVPARGWHGEAYRGHVFWDEVFVFPFLNLRLPLLTRSLLRYRHRRLEKARDAARAEGLRGALFPWQSGSDGREESQRLHLNPRSGRWIPDHTHLQRHVGSAIAFNAWQYATTTGDEEFLHGYGAELLLEIARMWGSLAELDPAFGRYRIRGVVGPDEFHTAYPGSDRPGIDDNAYTNVMASWTLARALEALDLLPGERRAELCERLGISGAELSHWDDVSRRLRVPFHDGVVSQFDGYERLLELDWERYRREHGDLHRLDRILEAQGDSANRYKASKQADVMMLFFLLSSEELGEAFSRLGYALDPGAIPRNVDYYASRTTHGSTLSRIVGSWVLARSDRRASFGLFREALESDVADVQGGTTQEGIHLGAMAGTVDLLQRCYTGIETREGILRFAPYLPREITTLRTRLRYRGQTLVVELTAGRLSVTSVGAEARGVTIALGEEIRHLAGGETCELDVPGGSLDPPEPEPRVGEHGT